jgi:hypothetical protein
VGADPAALGPRPARAPPNDRRRGSRRRCVRARLLRHGVFRVTRVAAGSGRVRRPARSHGQLARPTVGSNARLRNPRRHRHLPAARRDRVPLRASGGRSIGRAPEQRAPGRRRVTCVVSAAVVSPSRVWSNHAPLLDLGAVRTNALLRLYDDRLGGVDGLAPTPQPHRGNGNRAASGVAPRGSRRTTRVLRVPPTDHTCWAYRVPDGVVLRRPPDDVLPRIRAVRLRRGDR